MSIKHKGNIIDCRIYIYKTFKMYQHNQNIKQMYKI